MAGIRFAAVLFAALCIAFGPAAACIFKFGTSPDSLSAPHGGTHWDHGMNGDDWVGVDAAGKPWVCASGLRQSPINVPPTHALEHRGSTIPLKHQTTWSYPAIVSNGSNVEVINNGHAIQVEWLSPYAADVEIAVPAQYGNKTTITAVLGMGDNDPVSTVRATPLQFHFHSNSEHLVVGKYYPLEMHIVHKITDLPACAAAGGCFSVTGVLFELADGGDNPLLKAIWAAMPMREGAINYLPAGAEIHLEDLLPPANARDYVTYEGSLTTPPCTEGLLWHVMLKAQKISHAQWNKYKKAVALKDCEAAAVANETVPSAASPSPSATVHHRHHHRRLLEEEAPVNPNDYTCKVVAYGANYRSSQKLYGRAVKIGRAP